MLVLMFWYDDKACLTSTTNFGLTLQCHDGIRTAFGCHRKLF
ncbi:hypothetical protein BT93_G0649 [Corymbia citriodora subsp. variegata]|nr:hypothetical protein BT93_G0649 [Corymbia citriodora subsp. variegata]